MAALGYVGLETTAMLLANIKFEVFPLFAFYGYNFSFFYTVSFLFAPAIRNKADNIVGWSVGTIFIIMFYTLGSLILSSVITGIKTGEYYFNWHKGFVPAIVLRGLHFYFVAVAYWNARYRIKQVKENELERFLRSEAERKLLQVQNLLMKAQFEPHFLFNTLTAIYKNIVVKAPEEADSILLLADVMRYSSGQVWSEDKISIGEDLLHVQRILDLYSLQYKNNLNIRFCNQISGGNLKRLIPSLLFVEFLQNIFKHGDLTEQGDPAILIFSVEDNSLRFTSVNRIGTGKSTSKLHTGLVNVRTRLDYLLNGRYKLNISQEAAHFKVDLSIDL